MKVFREIQQLSSLSILPTVTTIGNFDGVHLGHRTLLKKARANADKKGLILTVITFDPHPSEFFNPIASPLRIALFRDQMCSFKECGVDQVLIIPFNRKSFAKISANDFVEKLLVKMLKTKSIWIGDDFRYGAERQGNYHSLKNLGKLMNFDVHQLTTMTNKDGLRISSTAIRKALANGNLSDVNRLLGHKYRMTGHVIHGNKLGRTLGFPTLNIAIRHRKPALLGVLIVQVLGLSQKALVGVANIGTRPTVDKSGQVLLEVYVLNWSGNAYGKIITVEFLHKLHDEKHYSSIDKLTEGIANDVENAKKWLRNHHKEVV